MCGEYTQGIDVCCRLKLVLELQSVGSTQKYLNQDCHMQRGLLRRGEEIRGQGMGTRASVGRTCSESKRGNSMLRDRKKRCQGYGRFQQLPRFWRVIFFMCLRLLIFLKQDIVLKIKVENQSSLKAGVLSCQQKSWKGHVKNNRNCRTATVRS